MLNLVLYTFAHIFMIGGFLIVMKLVIEALSNK